jgi:N-acetylglucosaminyldiphosphoundecaprenol N-acetyl-beta-D-mannosaminyltransferase
MSAGAGQHVVTAPEPPPAPRTGGPLLRQAARTDFERRIELLGCRLDAVDMREAVERCRRFIEQREFGQHMSINAAKLVALQGDHELREAVSRCELITADGQAVVWAARALGRALPARVTGIDLMLELLALAEVQQYRVYILGARPEVLERAIAQLRSAHPRLIFAGWRDGYFDEREGAAVAGEIRARGTDVLFVAISSPMKERFLAAHGRSTGASMVMGVGGAIDVIAGEVRRAPVALQRLGLEWLFRLAQEPRRLCSRYARTNTRFLFLIGRELARTHRHLLK